MATLARVFATFVPTSDAEARRYADLAAETLNAATDHAELRLLRLALGSLEVPAGNLAVAGVWGRFSTLDAERRAGILLAWSTHPIPRLRTAFQALKRLALFLAYGDGGEGSVPENARWDRIGYAPAHRAEPAASTIQPMQVDAAAASLELHTDAVIVGSGAGGGVVAARLAAAGMEVIVVEAGQYRPEPEMPRVEAEAFRDLYLDRGTTASADLGISILAGSGLGGGTTINWTTSLAPPDWLRAEWASVHGLAGFDGPEADADLARLRAELDLRPPTVVPPKDRLILEGAAALGWEAAPTERNAGPCTDCGACSFGCPSGAKRSGLRAHLREAARKGARFLVGARVDVVELHGGTAAAVHGLLQLNGRSIPFRVGARHVVLAAGPLRTPLILEGSGIGHPQLGRNLRLHPVVAVTARMHEPVDLWLGPSQAARSLQFARPGPEDAAGPAHGGFVIESCPPHPGLAASAYPWDGADAHAAHMRHYRFDVPLIAICRDGGSGRVRWSRGGHPRIEYRLAPADADSARRALVEIARLARAGGAQEVTALATPALRWTGEPGGFDAFLKRLGRAPAAPNRITLFSAHQMGTACAGADPGRHVCDPFGRVRSASRPVRGLYVGDASLFPSAPGVNPMLTVMALAERTARAVLADAR